METTQFRVQAPASAATSAARPLLMPAPGQSPGGRGSIPKYFPETFKDFFSMLAEDEDHGEVISNLLEDKVIPRSPRKDTSHRSVAKSCEKPFCCHNSGGSSDANGGSSGIYLESPLYSGGGLTRTLSSKYYRRRPSQGRLLPADVATNLLDSTVTSSGTSTAGSVTSFGQSNFGRSNSFRLHRPVASVASAYSSYMSYQPVVLPDRPPNSSNLNACKHIQYCCLHQQGGDGNHLQQSSGSCSTLSLNERTPTGRLLPISPAGPLRIAMRPQREHQAAQEGINFSDDDDSVYPQLGSSKGGGGGVGGVDGGNWDGLQQQSRRYSLLAKSYDQINRSRIFGEWESLFVRRRGADR